MLPPSSSRRRKLVLKSFGVFEKKLAKNKLLESSLSKLVASEKGVLDPPKNCKIKDWCSPLKLLASDEES